MCSEEVRAVYTADATENKIICFQIRTADTTSIALDALAVQFDTPR